AAAEGVDYHDEWPYVIHFLGYLYVDDINSARFFWKSIPSTMKEHRPELVAVWKIAQKLWIQDHRGVRRMFQLLVSAYSTISIHDAAHFLGMNEEEAKNYVTRRGWIVDVASEMLTVKKQEIGREQKLDSSKLQRLTEY
ncbi:COP9 signalosome complex subunit 8, partial [Cucurbita argyrosperma subsp. argyrosperma]